ncbi:MAG: restriction endonuclease, SacI family [Anaerolineales bacterium]|nr:restriction endonuclease, SacI family [Anaerolineales bacterium]
MKLKGTSRLPVLIVAAAYRAAEQHLGRSVRDLWRHNAADSQTGAVGDVEVTSIDSDTVVTSYEMKDRMVTIADVDRVIEKLTTCDHRIDNYIFITTEEIPPAVEAYARSLYEISHGIEFVILDCVGFLRHYLHLFHWLRSSFLENYQALILAEPDSAVAQPVKEAFLVMRQTLEVES